MLQYSYWSLDLTTENGGTKVLCRSLCSTRKAPGYGWVSQGFSLASAIGHSPKIVPDVREFAVQFGQFVRDDFRERTLYGNAQ